MDLRRHVVHQNIGVGHQILENPEALLSRNIEGDAALVSVEVKKRPLFSGCTSPVGNGPRVRERSPTRGRFSESVSG
jgi:hypothetical protein